MTSWHSGNLEPPLKGTYWVYLNPEETPQECTWSGYHWWVNGVELSVGEIYAWTFCPPPAPKESELLDHVDNIGWLLHTIERSGLRLTYDRKRSARDPCIGCGVKDWTPLVQVGSYVVDVGGGILRGDAVERPLCDECQEAFKADALAALPTRLC